MFATRRVTLWDLTNSTMMTKAPGQTRKKKATMIFKELAKMDATFGKMCTELLLVNPIRLLIRWMKTQSLDQAGRAVFWCRSMLWRPISLFSRSNKFLRKLLQKHKDTRKSELLDSWPRSAQQSLCLGMTKSTRSQLASLTKRSLLASLSLLKEITIASIFNRL